MMAMKGRFAEAYSTGNHPNIESDGSDISPRMDMVTAYDDSVKCMGNGFEVPVQVFTLSSLSSYEKKSLAVRLQSELEKIRSFEKKYALLRSNNVAVSNVQRAPQAIKSKKGSGLASKPGKKSGSVSNNKGRGSAWNRTSSGQFSARGGRGSASNPSAAVMKLCGNVMRRLTSHTLNWVFKDPVDVEGLKLTDYYTIIKQPMDFGTIKNKLASGKYQSPEDFCADVRLVFSNCMTYNPPGNQFYGFAQTMSEYFEKLWKDVEKKISKQNSQMLPETSGFHEEVIDVATKATPAKKRKLSPLQAEVTPESLRPRVTNEEKAKIREALEQEGDLSEKICTFLSENATGDKSEDDEIEIDIDTLSEDAWFTLSQLLDEYFLEKQKLSEKAEPCEIELRNEYGLSSSSMQADKGNEVVDEDIDIGVDEPPVSSYPTVEIERDTDMSNRKETDGGVATDIIKTVLSTLDHSGAHEKESVEDLAEGNKSASGVDQLEQSSQEKPNSAESESQIDGGRIPAEIQVSPEKLYRAALLKNRFADTILKAREKALGPIEKGDPEKLRREMEELELQKKKERARLQAEAKAAEDAKRRLEAAAAAEIKRKRELEREAARQELLKMEKTVEINENSRFFDDLNMLRAGPMEQLSSAAEDESMPDALQEGGFGSFKFEGDNALEQLGLYRKVDDDEEEEQHNALEQLGLYRKVEDEEEEEQYNASEQHMEVDDEEEEGEHTASEQHMKFDEEEEGPHNALEQHMKAGVEEGKVGVEEVVEEPNALDMKVDDEEQVEQHNALEHHMKVDVEEEGEQPIASEQHVKVDDEEEGEQPIASEKHVKVDNEEEGEQPIASEKHVKVYNEEEGEQPIASEQYMKVDDEEEGEQPIASEQHMEVNDEEEGEQPIASEQHVEVDDEEEGEQAIASEKHVKVDNEEEGEQPIASEEEGEQPIASEQHVKVASEEEGEQPIASKKHVKVDNEEEGEQPIASEEEGEQPIASEQHVKVASEEEGEQPIASKKHVKVASEEEGEQPIASEHHVKVGDEEEGEQPIALEQQVKVGDEEEGEQHNNPSPPLSVNKEEDVEEEGEEPNGLEQAMKVGDKEEGEQLNNPSPSPSVNKKDVEEGEIN